MTTSTAVASHADMANAMRALSMDALPAARCGHPGTPTRMADVVTVLFTRRVRVDPAERARRDRDQSVIGECGGFVGSRTFGPCGPAGALFAHFGITADTVAAACRSALATNPA